MNEDRRRDRQRTDTPTPDRIRSAFVMVGVWDDDRDEAVGQPAGTVEKWATGEAVPTTDEVGRIAMSTGFPLAFFYQPPAPKIGPMFICGDDGCEIVDDRPDAPVVPLARRTS